MIFHIHDIRRGFKVCLCWYHSDNSFKIVYQVIARHTIVVTYVDYQFSAILKEIKKYALTNYITLRILTMGSSNKFGSRLVRALSLSLSLSLALSQDKSSVV